MLLDQRFGLLLFWGRFTKQRGIILSETLKAFDLCVFKKLNKSKDITDDMYSGYEADVDKLTSKTIEAIDKVIGDKEKDLLTV